MKTDVLIVGAGPTGLMAANQLKRFGIDFIIIDVKDGPTIQSRAILTTSRSLEIYQQLGIAEDAVKLGEKVTEFNVFSEGKKQINVKIGEVGVGQTAFNFLLALEQSKNETLLYRHLQKNGSEVLWNTAFIYLQEDKDEINVTVKQSEQTKLITAKYVIACDGAKSPIRYQLNFKFEGGTYENKFFVADVLLQWNLTYDQLIVSPSNKNFCAFIPMAGEKNHRVIGTLTKGFYDKENIQFEDIKNLVLANLGIPVQFEKVNWFSVYNLHHRCVDQFQKGKVFLAGDAAHIHSPAGGQGMNTGLQDATNIAWKLAMVLKYNVSEKLLKTYNEERLPFAKWLLQFTDRAFTMMTSENKLIQFARKYIGIPIAALFLKNDALKNKVFKTVSQIGYSYSKSSLSGSTNTKHKITFKAGDRLPYFEKDCHQLFQEGCFHLLYIGKNNLIDEEQRRLEKLFPFPIKFVNSDLQLWKKFGVKSSLSILLRPDNYIAMLFDEFDENEIKKNLRKFE